MGRPIKASPPVNRFSAYPPGATNWVVAEPLLVTKCERVANPPSPAAALVLVSPCVSSGSTRPWIPYGSHLGLCLQPLRSSSLLW
ncbi:unnamed protein product [Arctia plantaginis]|uniref:Uncharacterized protein n=1 Tax=Arctia plantaginis TaxID=874455 RepID=A0A8S0ZYG7_ARCPL|nr:unnamed protein product [Arctia plantaginis]